MHLLKTITHTKKYLIHSLIILIAFLFVFQRFADELIEKELNNFDQNIITWIQALITPKLTTVMKFFTFLGSSKVLIFLLIVFVIILVNQKKKWESLFLVIALAGGSLFNSLLKWIFHRNRPTLYRLIEETGYSFPSGHSMAAFIFYGMLCILFVLFFKSKASKVIIVAFTVILIFTIGISRIYLGVHYPSDVIAGFAAGGVWLIICLMSLRIILEYRKLLT